MLLEFKIYFLQAKFKSIFLSEYVEIMLDLYLLCKKKTLPGQGFPLDMTIFRSHMKLITNNFDQANRFLLNFDL